MTHKRVLISRLGRAGESEDEAKGGGHHTVHHYTDVLLPWRCQMGQEGKRGRKKEEGERGREGRREGVSAVTKEVNKETSTTPKKSHWPAMAVT